MLLLMTLPAWGWGATGHRVVGQVAEHHLSPEIAAAVEQLMGQESLARASTWPDEIRSDRAHQEANPDEKRWHYINAAPDQSLAEARAADPWNIWDGIEQNLATLESMSAEMGWDLTRVTRSEWTAVRRPGERKTNRLMLRYDGTIGLNLTVGAAPEPLPFGCTVDHVRSDDAGVTRHRWTYTPGNPDDTDAWSRLFAHVLHPDTVRGVLNPQDLLEPA